MAQNINNGNLVITIPGLFDEDMVFIAKHDGVFAVAVNKTVVITDSIVEAEAWFGETSYTVANTDLSLELDEVIDLSDAGIDTTDGGVRAFQMVAQLVLVAGEPGPRAVKFLEHVVADDKFAQRVVSRKGQTVPPGCLMDWSFIDGWWFAAAFILTGMWVFHKVSGPEDDEDDSI